MDTLRRLKRASMRRKKGDKRSSPTRPFYHVLVSDVSLESTPTYQPHHLQVTLSPLHSSQSYASPPAKWEASLKWPQSGFAFFLPPFQCQMPVKNDGNDKELSSQQQQLLRQEVLITLENVDTRPKKKHLLKSSSSTTSTLPKRKVLAKRRIDLSEYKEETCDDGGNLPSPTLAKLKLYPESKKVSRCTVNIAIQRRRRPLAEDVEVEIGSGSAATPEPEDDNDDHRLLRPLPSSLAASDGIVSEGRRSLAASSNSVRQSHGSRVSLSSGVSVSGPDSRLGGGQIPTTETESTRIVLGQEQEANVASSTFQFSDIGARNGQVERSGVTTATLSATTTKGIASADACKSQGREGDVRTVLQSSTVSSKGASDGTTTTTSSITTTTTTTVETRQLGFAKLTVADSPNFLASRPGSMRSAGGPEAAEEQELLAWTRQQLSKAESPAPLKVTNLSSSWRNGLGFCALVHTVFPDLIPLDELQNHNVTLNCQLALSASRLVGVTELPDTDDAMLPQGKTNQAYIVSYLKRLRVALENPKTLMDDEVDKYKKDWAKRAGLFGGRRGCGGGPMSPLSLFHESASESEDKSWSTTPPATPRAAEMSSGVDVGVKAAVATPPPSPEPESTPPPPAVNENRQRVKDMIAQAHSAASDSERHRISVALDLSSISQELKEVDTDLEHLNHEQAVLERLMREEAAEEDQESSRAVLPRMIELVNEKNALILRQMQLNIFEKEAVLAKQQEKIRLELERLSNVDEEQKTEVIRNREQELMQELLRLVNEKNELVHHLDTQEQAIVESENIQEIMKKQMPSGGVAGIGEQKEECVIQ